MARNAWSVAKSHQSSTAVDDEGTSGDEYSFDEDEFETFQPSQPTQVADEDTEDDDEPPTWGRSQGKKGPWVTRGPRPGEEDDEEDEDTEDDEQVFETPGSKRNSHLRRLDPNSPAARPLTRYEVESVGATKSFKTTFFTQQPRKEIARKLWELTDGEQGSYEVKVFLPKWENKSNPQVQHSHYYLNIPEDNPKLADSPNPDLIPPVFRVDDFPEPTLEPQRNEPEIYERPREIDQDEMVQRIADILRSERNDTPSHSYWDPQPTPQPAAPQRDSLQFAKEVVGIATAALPLLDRLLPKTNQVEMLKALVEIGKESQRPMGVQDFIGALTPAMMMMLLSKGGGVDPGMMQGLMSQAGQQQPQQNPASTTAIAPVNGSTGRPRLQDLPPSEQPARQQPQQDPLVGWWKNFMAVSQKNPKKDNSAYWAQELALDDEIRDRWMDTSDEDHATLALAAGGAEQNRALFAKIANAVRSDYQQIVALEEAANVQQQTASGSDDAGRHQRDPAADEAVH